MIKGFINADEIIDLIFVYLSKDISRWLETPGAVLARVSIAVSLCLLFLLMQAGFILAERAMKENREFRYQFDDFANFRFRQRSV